MTTFLLDFSIIAIVAFCIWRGYRNGLIRGVFGVVTLIASLFLANTIARAYSEEFTGMLTPFVGGVIDTAISDATEDGYEPNLGGIDLSGIDLSGIDLDNIDLGSFELGSIGSAEVYLDEIGLGNIDMSNLGTREDFLTAYVALRHLGLPESASARVAQMTADDDTGRFVSDVIADKLSTLLSFIALFGIAFLLLAIIFTVIGNLIGFVFSLPGFKLVDIIAGSAFGLVKGLLIVLTIGVVIRYFGLLARDTIEGTSILRYIVNNNLIANILGV